MTENKIKTYEKITKRRESFRRLTYGNLGKTFRFLNF